MNGLLMIVFGICVARGIWALDEAQCSKYDCEQHMLSKLIRMEIRMDTFENMLKEIQRQEVKTMCDNEMCDDEWIRFQSSCYLFGTSNMNFEDAKSFCETSGGRLIHIRSSEENDFIKRHVAELSAPTFWIGLTDICTEGVWKWAGTDENVQFFNWNSADPNGERNQNCVAISAHYHNDWIDEQCTRQYRPICKK